MAATCKGQTVLSRNLGTGGLGVGGGGGCADCGHDGLSQPGDMTEHLEGHDSAR